MTLYNILCDLAEDGFRKIRIDLNRKTVSVGSQIVFREGMITQPVIRAAGKTCDCDSVIDQCMDVNELYAQYKVSIPSENEGSTRHYFKALPVAQLTDAQLVLGMPRLEARIRLEAYILLASQAGLLTWNDPSKFYWVGQDCDFILLRHMLFEKEIIS